MADRSSYQITAHAVDKAVERGIALDRTDAFAIIKETLDFGACEYPSGERYGNQTRIHIRDRHNRTRGGVIVLDHDRRQIVTVYVSSHVLTEAEVEARRQKATDDAKRYLRERGSVFDPNE
jgi:hypothetical protein